MLNKLLNLFVALRAVFIDDDRHAAGCDCCEGLDEWPAPERIAS
jgi:hypothetical protein